MKDWERAATTDPGRLAQAWRREPFNIGIAAGPSGLVVVDLDVPKVNQTPPSEWGQEVGIQDGSDVFAALAEKAGQRYPTDTFTTSTPSGGAHLYFARPTTGQFANTSGRLGWLIDTRADGGYVVAPGSTTDAGLYRTLIPVRPTTLPQWIIALLSDRSLVRNDTNSSPRSGRLAAAYAHATIRNEIGRVLDATPGTRNTTLNTAAFALGQLIAAGALNELQAAQALAVAARHIGLNDKEALATIRSGLAAGQTHPRRIA